MARCINEVLQFLCSLYYEYIHWPSSRAELERNAVRFYQKFGKPCTIGVIDGTQVAILRPSPAVEFSYLNRKVFHSMNVLVRNTVRKMFFLPKNFCPYHNLHTYRDFSCTAFCLYPSGCQ